MYKRILSLILCLLFISSAPAAALETAAQFETAPETRLMLNGAYLQTDALPQSKPVGVFLPLRTLIEALGGTVSWSQDTQSVSASLDGQTLLFQSGRCYLGGVLVDAGYFVSAGRTLVSASYFTQLGMQYHWDNLNQTAILQYNPKPTDASMFDLGFGTMETALGRPLTYSLNGFISLPDAEGPYPVVFVLHGSHPENDSQNDRNDAGFNYLLQALAESGYAALSLNVNIQYSLRDGEPVDYERLTQIFLDHYAALLEANAGRSNPYPYDLTGKLDLSKVAVIGHSRSGQGAWFIAQEMEALGHPLSALLAVAPGVTLAEMPLPDVPAAILLPQHDGDVTQLDGQSIYDELTRQEDRESISVLTYLYGGTHNAFNEALWAKELFNPVDVWYDYLPDETQREFLTAYALDFLAASLNGQPSSIIYGDSAPSTLYGCDVLTSVYDPSGITLLDAASIDTLFRAYGVSCTPVLWSAFYKENTAGAFNPPGYLPVNLLAISWDVNANSYLEIPVAQENSDFSEKRMLLLSAALDSADARNGGAGQSVTLQLVDSMGNIASVTLEDEPALSYQAGELVTYEVPDATVETWSSFTPLSDIRISLGSFHEQTLDLQNITAIRLLFDTAEQGKIMLHSVRLA